MADENAPPYWVKIELLMLAEDKDIDSLVVGIRGLTLGLDPVFRLTTVKESDVEFEKDMMRGGQ